MARAAVLRIRRGKPGERANREGKGGFEWMIRLDELASEIIQISRSVPYHECPALWFN